MPLTPHALALRGGEIASRFGLAGEQIGALKRRLLDRVVAGELPNLREELLREAERMLGGEADAGPRGD